VAALVTLLTTSVVRRLAVRFSIIVVPDDRRVHEKPTPTLGGAAMFLGFLVAMAVASQLPAFRLVFRANSEPLGLVVGAAVIFTVGMADDLREMSPPAKMSGQILAGTILYLFGVTMLFFRLPLVGTTLVLSPDLSPVFTVLWVVGIANAVNFIDGLDGLAAGIIAIASGAFFLYSHQFLAAQGPLSNSGPLVAIIVCGICAGFLPHNFHPAKIFMGDAGAMLLGLLMAGSTMSVVGETDISFSGRTFFTFAPIVIPFFILGIPLLDTAFAVIRRASKRANPAVADKSHLHHRLMRLGHGQTRSVLILWAWTALLSGLVLYPVLTDHNTVLVPMAVVALGIILYTIFARGRRGAVPAAGPALPAVPPEPGPGRPGAPTGSGPQPPAGGGRMSRRARRDRRGRSDGRPAGTSEAPEGTRGELARD
jgi:UDP-GlcNAc:undecaprenyl-phosphate GlcNAc-1-phosphate transferase